MLRDRQTVAGLARSLGLLFAAMALPIAVLIWHAYGQLEWESFHRSRTLAEDLSNRIDDNLARLIAFEQSRPAADYTYRQRSALSGFPVSGSAAGTLGYFQIDAGGTFSSPVLPAAVEQLQQQGMDENEIASRRHRAQELRAILNENRLLETAALVGSSEQRAHAGAAASPMAELAESAAVAQQQMPATAVAEQSASVAVGQRLEGQLAFDKLSPSTRDSDAAASSSRPNTEYELASRLKLDSSYDIKSKILDRKKQSDVGSLDMLTDQNQSAQPGMPASLHESLRQRMEKDTGPMEFSRLDSGHFILFRRVWNEQQGLIQGLLIDQAQFLDHEVASAWRESSLSSFSNLVIAFNQELINRYAIGGNGQQGAQQTLLYQRMLSAPLGAMQLVYTVDQLPPGPGAGVLLWVSLAVAVVFAGGFYFLFQLGKKQLALATQQRNFVSSVSHELKTPLTSIRMYSEMLKSGWVGEDKKQGYYQYIHEESERLSRLISNVLKLSSISNNELELNLVDIALSELMQQVESRVSVQFQHSDVALRIDIQPGIAECQLRVEQDSFIQVIINLIDNALKFSGKGEKNAVDLHCSKAADDEVLFAVRDYGPGVPRDQLKNIFRLFYRPENELTRETVGTGIGLSIVQQLVSKMHGRVDVVNVNPGAQFRVFLPCRQGRD